MKPTDRRRTLEHERRDVPAFASVAAATSPFAPAPMTIASKRFVMRGRRQ